MNKKQMISKLDGIIQPADLIIDFIDVLTNQYEFTDEEALNLLQVKRYIGDMKLLFLNLRQNV